MKVRELVVKLGFDVDTKALNDVDKGLEAIKVGAFGLTAAITGAGVALFALVRTAANGADEITRLARAAGTGVEDLQRLGYAASLSGASTEALGVGLRVLSRNMHEAATNATGTFAQAFQRLKIRVTDANGQMRQSGAVLLDLAERVRAIPNPTERAAVAMELLGRQGGDLVEFLAKGPDEIARLSAELEAFGGVLNEGQLKTLADFNDSLTRLGRFFGAIRDQLAVGLAPTLTKVINDFREFLIVNQEVIRENLAGFVKGLSDFLKTAWKGLRFLGETFMWFIKVLGGAEMATKALLYGISFLAGTTTVAGIMALVSAVKALGMAFVVAAAKALIIPALITAALAAVFLIVEDIVAFFQGKDSVTAVIVDAFGSAFDWVKQRFAEFVDWFMAKGKAISDWVKNSLNPVSSFFQGAADFAAGVVNGGSGTGITPAATGAGSSSVRTANIKVDAPITVNVPSGTDPVTVGERVESGVGLGLEDILRTANRSTSPSLGY